MQNTKQNEEVDILDWLANPAELRKKEALRIMREVELAEVAKIQAKEAELQSVEITKSIIKYHHKNGYDYINGKRCYCVECAVYKDEHDRYYGEKGDW